MPEPKEPSKGLAPAEIPDRGIHTPTSIYNTQERDVEANLPNSETAQSKLGNSYGMGKDDLPSYPPRHTKSQASLRRPYSKNEPPDTPGGNEDTTADEVSVAEDLAWGPSHPCFPHLNPHVPLDSTEYAETRIIRIRRDWLVRGDLAPTYSNLWPEILDTLVSEQEFRLIIHKINQALVIAFNPLSTHNWIDGLMGVATCWLWEDLGFGGVKKQLRDLEAWLEEWNRHVGCLTGVKLIPLRRTGYMSLDIQIPDPQISIVEEEKDELAQGGAAEKRSQGRRPTSATLRP